MGIVPFVGLVFHMGDGDGDTALKFFGRVVNLDVGRVYGLPLQRQHNGEGRRQAGLPVVNVTDRADVAMWFLTCEFFFGHCFTSLSLLN